MIPMFQIYKRKTEKCQCIYIEICINIITPFLDSKIKNFFFMCFQNVFCLILFNCLYYKAVMLLIALYKVVMIF